MGLMGDTVGALSAKLGELVCSRKVLVPNGKAKRNFPGRIVGHFERVGPNPWDDYQFTAKAGGPIDVMPGIKVQVDPSKPRIRMRMGGRVVVVEWEPTDADYDKMGEPGNLRAAFLDDYVEHFDHKAGIGVAAFIANTKALEV